MVQAQSALSSPSYRLLALEAADCTTTNRGGEHDRVFSVGTTLPPPADWTGPAAETGAFIDGFFCKTTHLSHLSLQPGRPLTQEPVFEYPT
ncbi:Hypp7696 [Branchiostoma lanceolatum]|uniref:Hypp7696 protein n=1 Tax=Branchiostoma lanceolatum TaxID=7740 RepID=A0A8J9Z369_BRALA|nr:Hypp7696 [Branchiostoma lanceolatum]